ncbi:hypothetical protein Daesc_008465 [Daldinia eschscholtzii]|uniref:Fungal-type protein kinase domain-containing protein n=1 Tax=Daldinia eschscholtzii TaxID=292717 RepID=A0AAX6MBW7_9PEZI
MIDDLRSKIILENPIGKGLETFRVLFDSACKREGVVRSPGAVEQLSRESLRDLVNLLLLTLQVHPASSLLAVRTGRGTLRDGLRQLQVALNSDDLDLDRIKPLPKLALADDLDDALIWDQAYLAVTESTPPPRPIASALQQTPWFSNTGGFTNSSEQRQDVDQVLKSELGPLYVGLPNFRKTYFGNVAGLEEASEAVFKKCKEGNSPLFSQGWSGWPRDANQDDVLRWFSEVNEKLLAFAEKNGPTPSHRRRPLAQPNKPIPGSTGERKMDIGFVNVPSARRDSRCHWSEVLVPGELKSNPSSDIASKAWLDLAKYAREVLAAQDTRRFVLGFTICGSLMRIWEFDRLGGLASEQFDINQDGLQFVSTVLGFHWMSEEQLGLDPTISTEEDGRRVVTIRRNGRPERLVIDKLMKRAPCIVGRATTCWKAYREGNPQTPLVIKDSWQYTERDEEGELLKEATEKGVVNVARYYHHETVFVSNKPDDVRGNVRGGLAITEARNYRTARPMFSPITSTSTVSAPRQGRSSGAAGVKRSSSQSGACLPSSKRPCSASSTKTSSKELSNRIHRRTIVRDFGTPHLQSELPICVA